jgi:vitamin B12 transporter
MKQDFYAQGDAARFEYEGVFKLNDSNIATFGAETERTTLKTHSGYDPTPVPTTGHVRTTGVYGQWQTTLFDRLTLTGGVRYTDNSEFGGHTSVKIAGAWQLFDGSTTLRANYGDGFKAPSLYELFSQYSNPVASLKPETATGWEIGIDRSLPDGRLRASVTYFDRHTRNQIDFFSCYGGVVSPACTARASVGGYYYNIGRSHASGVELALTAQLTETLSLTANYTNMTAVNDRTGKDLARRPRNAANAVVTWTPSPKWSAGVRIDYVGARYDDPYQSVPLASFTGAGLFGSYRLTDTVELYARIENALDAHEEPVAGYGRPGRAAYGGVRISL